MRKAAAAVRGSPALSPQSGPESPFLAEMTRRTTSGGGGTQPRVPSSLSIRKDSPLPRTDSIPGTPVRGNSRATVTRMSSSNTMRNLGSGNARPAGRSSTEAQRTKLSSLSAAASADEGDDDPPSPGAADASPAASSSSSSSSPAQSRIIRRPPRFQSNDTSSSFADVDDDDTDAEPAFPPYNPQAEASTSGQHDLSATLRGNPDYATRRIPKKIHHSHTSDSSTSSAAMVPQGAKLGGPISPRRTMEVAGRSPGGKGKGYARDSDGTPSMGSSFSDLDGTCNPIMIIFSVLSPSRALTMILPLLQMPQ